MLTRVKKPLKIAGLVLAGFVLLLLLLAGLTQTQLFRDQLRSFALSELDSLLDADVQLGELTGNLVTGFSLGPVDIRVRGQECIHLERLDLRYDLFEIPGKNITVGNLTLVRPVIHLLRNTRGEWNIDHLVRPTPPDTTASSFGWTIAIRTLHLIDATIMLVDSGRKAGGVIVQTSSTSPVDYGNFTIDHLNLLASAALGKHETSLSIESVTCGTSIPGIALGESRGTFAYTPEGSRVENLVLTTLRSSLHISAGLQGIDLLAGFGLGDLRNAGVSVRLEGDDIDLDELKRFLPPLHFLSGPVGLHLVAGGSFGDVAVESLDIRRGATHLNISGHVRHLDHPGDLLLNVSLRDSKVSSADAISLLPVFHLPDYSSLGVTTLSLQFDGTPLAFATSFTLQTDAGTVRSPGVSLTIGGPRSLAYAGEITTEGFDPGRAFGLPELGGSLNTTSRVDGAGVSLDELQGQVRIQVDSSRIGTHGFERCQLFVEAAKKVLSGTVVLRMGDLQTALTADANLGAAPDPSFSVSGEIRSLNLARLLDDPGQESDLTMHMKASGTGFSWDKLSGTAELAFSPSRYRDYSIGRETVSLSLDQHDRSDKRLELRSRIADLSLRGSFNTDYMMRLIDYETQSLRIAAGQKLASLDSSLTASVDRKKFEQLGKELAAAPDTLQTSFTLHVKDLEPVSIVASNRIFNGTGVLSGHMSGNFNDLKLDTRLDIDEFFYGNADSGVYIENCSARLEMNDLLPVDPLVDLDFVFVTDARRMHINRDELDSLRITFTYQQQFSSYTARTHYGPDVKALVQGYSSIIDSEVVFTFNTLQCAFREYAWSAEGGAFVGFSPRGVRIANLTMRRDEQEVGVDGFIGIDGAFSAFVRGSSLDLDGLKYVLTSEGPGPRRKGFSGLTDISLAGGGTLAHPEYDLSVKASSVAFRSVPFGSIDGTLKYRNKLITCDLSVDALRDSLSRAELMVTGTIPVDLSIGGSAETVSDSVMNLTIQSDGVQMNVLDPLLPTFNDLRGVMKCNLRLVGSPRNPDFRGFITIDDCSFLFTPNNIYYTLEGKFQPEGERINVLTATIRNIPADKKFSGRDGVVNVFGDFAFRDFVPSDFNLTCSGQLLLVKETTARSELSVSGNLFVEIKDQGLRFTGNVDSSWVRGGLLVRNSSLIFPPNQEPSIAEQKNRLPVIFVGIDTLAGPRYGVAHERYFGTTDQENNRPEHDSAPTRSFVDGIHYDLDIETSGGNTRFTMIFDNRTDEKLEANIEGKFSVQKDGRYWVGELEISRAFYNFVKRFDASGKIRFYGNFMNPELDITARYEGTRKLESRTEKVVVTIKITGFRNQPKLEWGMTIDDEDYASYAGPKSNSIENDAITFIIAGNFATSEVEKNSVVDNLGTSASRSIVSGAVSSLLTGQLSTFLQRETGFINSVDFRYGEGETFGQSADVRISATIGDGVLTYGGRIFQNPFSNANVSILYSVGSILKEPTLRNFMFELERKVEFGVITESERKEVNSARLFYRFSF